VDNEKVFPVMPPEFPMEVVGLYVRVGPNTLVRADQIVALQAWTAVIWEAPQEPLVVDEPDPEEDESEEEGLTTDPAPTVAPDPAGERESARQRVAAVLADIKARQTPPDDAPRVPMTRLYLENHYGSVMVETPDGRWTSQPSVRHSPEAVSEAIMQATGNKAAAEAKVMSGMIAREITEDPRFTEVEPERTAL
jgi:hypothetical protein